MYIKKVTCQICQQPLACIALYEVPLPFQRSLGKSFLDSGIEDYPIVQDQNEADVPSDFFVIAWKCDLDMGVTML